MSISMTTFLDFVTKAGRPKATVVKGFKAQKEYKPWFDYYKQIREAIVQYHKSGVSILKQVTPIKKEKAANYAEVLKGHNKWKGRKALLWFDPPHSLFVQGSTEINVNPELGLDINGIPHVIKLYFKAPAIPKNRVEVALELMEQTLRSAAPANTVMAVLDLQRAKLSTSSGSDPLLASMLKAEAAHWETLFSAI